MDNQLLTLSKIFSERLFRIPDYQRGYAWGEKQTRDFWNDLQQLEPGHNHYTGVLTIEQVPQDTANKWEDDAWIINAKSYQPVFVVDGQQRLTTAIVLIQVILERLSPAGKLNFTERSDIQRKFIFDSKDEGISRSYIFGYEKDNPSYEYLKTKIFGEHSSYPIHSQETVYTQNLFNAKKFFAEKVRGMSTPELEALYRKLTRQLLFNIFTITADVDVCVAFETMNNRGKPLSYLELLKNRLIYLTLKFEAEEFERNQLRRAINDCWKSIYHNLGRNKAQPLNDDSFLVTHYIVYFGDTLPGDEKVSERLRYRRYRANYAEDLLERRFVTKNVDKSAPVEERITLTEVYKYVKSLQESVGIWYKMWNPTDSDLDATVQIWLDKLNRQDAPGFHPLILAFLQRVADPDKRVAFLQALERHQFVTFVLSRRYGGYRLEDDHRFASMAIELRANRMSGDKVTKAMADATSEWLKDKDLGRSLTAIFKQEGFYGWAGIRYFLFEYNLDLQSKSRTERPKISWPEFCESPADFVSVEHIYPKQARHPYWTQRFDGYTQKQRDSLRNSLGNLLPLSIPKNASLSNKPFPEKVDGKTPLSLVGYRYGSYAENEVAKLQEWTPAEILNRGLRLLSFMERRWKIEIGDESQKRAILSLEFVK